MTRAANDPSVFTITITGKVHTRGFSWLKVPDNIAFKFKDTIKTLC